MLGIDVVPIGTQLLGKRLYSALIRKLQTVEKLTDSETEAVIDLCADVRVTRRRRDIVTEGTHPDHIHVILDGWAARYKVLRDGSRRLTAILLPGDFCDLHVTTLAAMDHGIVALSDCQVAFVGAEEIDRITRSMPALTRALWRSTLIDASILRQWLVNAGRRDAFEKIGHLLCELHARLQLVGLVRDERTAFPLTQDELGDATGLTGIHVNRTLRRLREASLVEIADGEMRMLDGSALRRACDFNPDYLHLRN